MSDVGKCYGLQKLRQTALTVLCLSAMAVLVSCNPVGRARGVTEKVAGTPRRILTGAYQGVRTTRAAAQATKEITPDYEYRLGRSVAAQLIAAYGVYQEPEAVGYLNRVGSGIVQFSDPPEVFAGYHFIILDTDELNAYAAPGAFILVTRGLLQACSSEDEVAAILAHEIAHLTNRHALRTIKGARWTDLAARGGLALASGAVGADLSLLSLAFTDAAADVIETVTARGYSRGMENDADEDALKLLRKTGYNSLALEKIIRKLERKGDSKLSLMRTHSLPEKRLAYLEELLSGVYAPDFPHPEREARFSRFAVALRGADASLSHALEVIPGR